jgi:pheromone receptor transcription factor
VLLLVVSETGLVYTFTTPKLQPLVTKPEGKNLIQVRCNHRLSRRIASLTPLRPV